MAAARIAGKAAGACGAGALMNVKPPSLSSLAPPIPSGAATIVPCPERMSAQPRLRSRLPLAVFCTSPSSSAEI